MSKDLSPSEASAEDAEGVAEDGADTEASPGLEKTKPHVAGETHLKSVLESLVFVADKPVTVQRLAKLTRAKQGEVKHLLDALMEEYQHRGVQLLEVAGGYQFRSAAVNAPFVRDMVARRPVRLTRAQLETMAIVAYRQPVTRPEVDDIRGVDSGSALKVLADRSLIKILGRKDEPGRPLLYGTTPQFLEFFGLSSLKDLPTLEEFTELSDESRTLFEQKMGDMDLSQMAEIDEAELEATDDDDDDEAGEGSQAKAEGDAEGAQEGDAAMEGDGDPTDTAAGDGDADAGDDPTEDDHDDDDDDDDDWDDDDDDDDEEE